MLTSLQSEASALTLAHQTKDQLSPDLIASNLLKCKEAFDQARIVRLKIQKIDPNCREIEVLKTLEDQLLTIDQELRSSQKAKIVERALNKQHEEILENVTQARLEVEQIESHFKEIINEPPDSPEEVISLLRESLIQLVKLRLVLRKYALHPEESIKFLVDTVLSKQQKTLIKVRKMFSQTMAAVLATLAPEQLQTKAAAFVTILQNRLQSWRPYVFDNEHLMTLLSQLEVMSVFMEPFYHISYTTTIESN